MERRIGTSLIVLLAVHINSGIFNANHYNFTLVPKRKQSYRLAHRVSVSNRNNAVVSLICFFVVYPLTLPVTLAVEIL
jgi:hypothetical protein